MLGRVGKIKAEGASIWTNKVHFKSFSLNFEVSISSNSKEHLLYLDVAIAEVLHVLILGVQAQG